MPRFIRRPERLFVLLALATAFGAVPDIASALPIDGTELPLPPDEPDPPPPPPPPPPPVDCDDACGNVSCLRPSADADRDVDGIPDRLEYDLADRFFPHILLQHADTDRDESYLYQGFSIPYTARPISGGICAGEMRCIEIRYGIAFFYDHGDMGMYDHLGDSEMYAMVLRRTASWADSRSNQNRWALVRDYTSAHEGTSSDSSRIGAYGMCPECDGYCQGGAWCTGVDDQALCASRSCNWVQVCPHRTRCYSDTSPTLAVDIYAAENKHALYHSDSECDNGGFTFLYWDSDDCPRSDYTNFDMRAWARNKLQNVGNGPLAPASALDGTIQDPSGCGEYDVWSGDDFGSSSDYAGKFQRNIPWAL